ASAEASAAGDRSTILLVEDERMLLDPMKSLLEDEGFHVLTATDGIEAVARHAEHNGRIAAVVLDLGLPRLSGWQAFLKMRETDPNLRCIVASGNLDQKRRSAMEQEGVAATLRKPYAATEVLEVVRRVVGGAS